MKFFGKKKEESKKSCCCGGDCSNDTMSKAEKEKATVEALKELNMDTTVEHVTDFSLIASYGVMTTPALVVDGKVVSFGKVLKKDEVIEILKKCRG